MFGFKSRRQMGKEIAAKATTATMPVVESQGDLSASGWAWVQENGRRWEASGKVRYYINDRRAILEMAGWEITEERKGAILSIEGLSHRKTWIALAAIDGIYYDAVAGRMVGKGGQIFEDLVKALTTPDTGTDPDASNSTQGAATTILTSAGAEDAHYEVREITDIIPSHDPANQFARNPHYPAAE